MSGAPGSRLAALILAVLVAFGLSGCGSGDHSTPQESPSSAASKKPAGVSLAKVKKAFSANMGGRKIADMCDAERTHWACYYDGISRHNASAIQVELSTPGDVSKTRQKELAKKAALHWFNFVGEDNPKLAYIVVYVNGLDSETLRRSAVPLLN